MMPFYTHDNHSDQEILGKKHRHNTVFKEKQRSLNRHRQMAFHSNSGLLQRMEADPTEIICETVEDRGVRIGHQMDRHEKEAGRIARQVMNMSEKDDLHERDTSGNSHSSEIKERNQHVSKGMDSLGANLHGRPLPRSVRNFFEPRFEQDFSHVRIHTDAQAAEMADELNARAFTFGSNIVFSGGEYTPGSSSGNALLSHELTHVVQQTHMRGEKRSNRSNVDISQFVDSPLIQRERGRRRRRHRESTIPDAELVRMQEWLMMYQMTEGRRDTATCGEYHAQTTLQREIEEGRDRLDSLWARNVCSRAPMAFEVLRRLDLYDTPPLLCDPLQSLSFGRLMLTDIQANVIPFVSLELEVMGEDTITELIFQHYTTRAAERGRAIPIVSAQRTARIETANLLTELSTLENQIQTVLGIIAIHINNWPPVQNPNYAQLIDLVFEFERRFDQIRYLLSHLYL
ncbi:MAG: DUF4157 domain-containing protein [Proteobacteria bacterium]|nr:DUF4157 domain-containing protein [Pseudomonadota bacterium]